MSEHAFFQGETVNSSRILYTSSSFAKESLFFLQETGSLTARQPHRNQRTYLDSYLFLCVTSGSGAVISNGQRYELSAGDAALIDCHLPYSHQSSDDLWSLSWVHFNGSTMDVIYQKFVERCGGIVFQPSQWDVCRSLLNQIYETAGSQSYVRDMEIHESLSSLLTMIMRDCWNETESSIHVHNSIKPIQEIHDYLREHCTEKVSLDELSSMFFINKYYLTRLFRQQYGLTISDYILEQRITVAKQKLRFTRDSIEEISQECGFYDLAYFSRKFKKAEGITPSAFRKQWQ